MLPPARHPLTKTGPNKLRTTLNETLFGPFPESRGPTMDPSSLQGRPQKGPSIPRSSHIWAVGDVWRSQTLPATHLQPGPLYSLRFTQVPIHQGRWVSVYGSGVMTITTIFERTLAVKNTIVTLSLVIASVTIIIGPMVLSQLLFSLWTSTLTKESGTSSPHDRSFSWVEGCQGEPPILKGLGVTGPLYLMIHLYIYMYIPYIYPLYT